MGVLDRQATGVTPAPIVDALAEQGMNGSAAFGPGRPINPFDGYSRRPRAFDYPVGVNITTRPRAQYGRASFETLKAIIDAWDLARICINHRVDDLRSMELLFNPTDATESNVDAAVAAARAALAFPDRELPFDAWLAKWLESVLRYDAGTLYRRRDMAGRVTGLEVIDGTSVYPVIDGHGRRPRPPAPAYGQYVKGLPWEWLTTDDLIYTPFRPQADSPYGMAPIETILLTANTDLRYQHHLLSYFTAGSLPAGFLHAPVDATSPDQVAEWQDFWDALMVGDQDALRQVKVVPHDMAFTPARETPFDETFPIYLMRRVCAAYGVTPQDLGITLDVNRANGDTQTDVQFRVNTRPLMLFVQGILSRYLQNDLGLPVKVEFDDGQEKEDRLNEARTWQVYIDSGVASADEAREKVLGLPTDPARPVPRFINNPRTGPVPLASLLAIAGPIDPTTAGPVDDVPLSLEPFTGAHGVLADKSPGGTQFKRAPIDPDEPEFPQLERPVPGSDVVGTKPGAPTIGEPAVPVAKEATAGVTATTGLDGFDMVPADDDDDDDDEDDDELLVKSEAAAFRRFVKARAKAGKWRDFTFTHTPADVAAGLNAAGRVEVTKAGKAAVGPGSGYHQRLADHHAKLIAAALAETFPKEKLEAAARAGVEQ